MRWVIVFTVGFLITALTGAVIQTQVLHNTTPIAQRDVASDLVIGGDARHPAPPLCNKRTEL